MDVKFDHKILRKVISEIKLPAAGEAEWCIACGACAESSKLNVPEELIKKVGPQFVEPQAIRELVNTIKAEGGEAAWCIACGAGALASPLEQVSTPVEVSDELIESISKKLIKAVKLE